MPRLIKKRKRQRMPIKETVVLYHKNCTDGFGAAWAAWQKFGAKAEYIAIDPRQLPETELVNRTIYVLDNSFSKKEVLHLAKTNKNLVIIDHHISSEKDVESAPGFVFDNSHSGAVLAWKFFHPGEPIPNLLLHVEDQDLYSYVMPHTKEFFAAFDLIDFNFKLWDSLVPKLERAEEFEKFVRQGKLLLRYEEKLIDQIVQNAEVVRFKGIKTLAVNSPVFESQIGHVLYKKLPPMGIVWRVKNGRKTFSLRSDGTVDVSKLAGKFGGGGHAQSSGFALPGNKKLPWKVLEDNYEL